MRITDKMRLDWLDANRTDWFNNAQDDGDPFESNDWDDATYDSKRYMSLRSLADAGIRAEMLRTKDLKRRG